MLVFCSCKYVRKGHIQTATSRASYLKSWKKASFCMPSLFDGLVDRPEARRLPQTMPLDTSSSDCETSADGTDAVAALGDGVGSGGGGASIRGGGVAAPVPLVKASARCGSQSGSGHRRKAGQNQKGRKREGKRPRLLMLVGIPGVCVVREERVRMYVRARIRVCIWQLFSCCRVFQEAVKAPLPRQSAHRRVARRRSKRVREPRAHGLLCHRTSWGLGVPARMQ